MGACSLRVVLDEANPTVHPGDELRGRVEVEVSDTVRCDALKCCAAWFAHGKGSDDDGDVDPVVLFSGEWTAGQYEYPFAIKAPLGPYTYRGAITNLDWRVKATADIPWAVDPKAIAEFVLVERDEPTSQEPYYFGPNFKPPLEKEEAAQLSPTASGKPATPESDSVFLTVIAVGIGVVVVGAVAASAFLLLPIIAVIVGAVYLSRSLRRGAIGEPVAVVAPKLVMRGGTIHATIRFTARKTVSFGKVHATLRARERASKGSGSSRRHFHHLILEDERLLPITNQVLPAQEHTLEVKFPLSASVPYTFAAPDNEVEWRLLLGIELLGLPDWSQEVVLGVRPGRPPRHPFRG